MSYFVSEVAETNVHANPWLYMGGSRGGTGGPDPPLKNHKNIGLFSNMGQSYQASIQCRVIIGTLANRHLNGVHWWADDGPLI